MESVSPEVLYIRPQDVARIYSISAKTVYVAIWNKELPARKIAKKVWLIKPSDAQKWIENKMDAMEQHA